MQEELELALQKIAELERKMEKYYQLLHINNELDFILNGGYVTAEEIEKLTAGNY